MKSGIKVFAPATVANVAVGFDALGFAIDKPGDEVIVRLSEAHKGLQITTITGGKLPYEVEKNTAGVAALRLLEHLGETERGIDMEIHKKMPFGSGLGSSAASAAAAVVAINQLLKSPLTKRELLPFAVEGESLASGSRHADNIAPCLLGGMILIRDNHSLDVHRIITPKGLYITVIYPKVSVLTKEARAILKPEVPLQSAIQQTANMGGLLIGMYNSDFDLIARSLQDVLIEPQRAALIPHFAEVKEAALAQNGVLGCSISGSGPSIFAMSRNSLAAENIADAMKKVFERHKIETQTYVSTINHEGTILM